MNPSESKRNKGENKNIHLNIMTIVNRICVLLILFFAVPILPLSPSYTRRTVLTSLSSPIFVAGVVAPAFVAPASAKTGTVASQQFATSSPSTKITKVSPQVAYNGIKQAREELKGGELKGWKISAKAAHQVLLLTTNTD